MAQEEARLNVRIDKHLLQEARIKAIREGSNLSQIVRDLLTHYTASGDVAGSIPREREACKRIAAEGGVAALESVVGPIPHQVGYFVWHFSVAQQRGRLRCIFRNDVTGERIPDQWQLYWIEDPLERK